MQRFYTEAGAGPVFIETHYWCIICDISYGNVTGKSQYQLADICHYISNFFGPKNCISCDFRQANRSASS